MESVMRMSVGAVNVVHGVDGKGGIDVMNEERFHPTCNQCGQKSRALAHRANSSASRILISKQTAWSIAETEHARQTVNHDYAIND
jgi:hypothetical protein